MIFVERNFHFMKDLQQLLSENERKFEEARRKFKVGLTKAMQLEVRLQKLQQKLDALKNHSNRQSLD